MDFGKNKSESENDDTSSIIDQTSKLFDETKKLAEKIYNEGKENLEDLQSNIKENTDTLAQEVQAKPLYSLLIAASFGFLLILNEGPSFKSDVGVDASSSKSA